MAILSEMDDPVPDLGFGLAVRSEARVGSHHFFKPADGMESRRGFFLSATGRRNKIRGRSRRRPPPWDASSAPGYWAVALALLLAALSVSVPASKRPLPLQSFQLVTT